LLDLINSASLLACILAGEFSLFNLPLQLFFFPLQRLNFVRILILQLLKGIGSQPLSLKFLNNFISINDTSNFFELSEGLLVIIELLSLIILVMFVTVPIAGGHLLVVDIPVSFGCIL